MRPFLRWAGSKKWLIRRQYGFEAQIGHRYIEPFLGSGSMFFSLLPDKSLLSDSNQHLINCFKHVKESPLDFFLGFNELYSEHCKEQYYEVRNNITSDGLQAAVDFLYLNRTCFNGVFRVNLSGRFNVPVGTKAGKAFTLEDFLCWSQALSTAEIRCADFEEVVDASQSGDVLFVDPPYTVAHNNNGFIEYNEKIFLWSDQVRLAGCLTKAAKRGVHFLLTNADHPSIRELYQSASCVAAVSRRSVVAGDVDKRSSVSELLISTQKLHGDDLVAVDCSESTPLV